jgi:Ca-activated chloride channel homolog
MRTTLTLVLVCFTTGGLVYSQQGSADATLSPYFFIDGGSPGLDTFPLESTDVVADISGVIANVTVTQVYENRGTVPIHGRYVFPGSTRAAVHGMRIRVGDRALVAQIREREQAAREFGAARSAGQTASLLEQERPNVFTMSVANILPGDRVEVGLSYSELLIPEQGTYEFVYPAVVGPRYPSVRESEARADDRWVESPYLHEGEAAPAKLSIEVNLSSGVPISDLRASTNDSRIVWDDPSLARVSLENDPGSRDFILEYRLAGQAIQTGLLVFEDVRENFFLLTVQPPARVAAQDIPPREYIFVLDVSGSMNGFPIETAKEVVRNLIGNLRPSDTFNVILFSGGSRVLSPTSLAASPQNVSRALNVITRERGGGGTELLSALRRAIELPRSDFVSRSVVVITDGYIARERDAFALIHDNLDSTNFFAFGIGSSVNRHLVEGIARVGQGEPFVVTSPAEASAMGARFRQYIETPVLTDIDVRFLGFDAYDVEPERQGDLFAERPVVLIGKWQGPREGQIEVTGHTASGVFTAVIDAEDSVTRSEHSALPQLWARRRIARLSDFDVGADDAEAVREVTSLGLTYSLLTPHTSFVAVLEQVRNTTGPAIDVQQPLPLPDGVSDLAVGYGSGSEPEFRVLLLGTVVLLALLSRTARRRAASC